MRVATTEAEPFAEQTPRFTTASSAQTRPTAVVERIALVSVIEASGLLAFNERDVTLEQVRSAGLVERVWPLTPGDVIAAGQPLAEILVPEWSAAQAEFLVLRANADLPQGEGETPSARRETVLERGSGGMLSIAGGKLTAYRKMAERIVDLVGEKLGRTLRPCQTDHLPLPGGACDPAALERTVAAALPGSAAVPTRTMA